MNHLCDICPRVKMRGGSKVYEIWVKGHPDLTSGHISIFWESSHVAKSGEIEDSALTKARRYLVKPQMNA